jgi:hypothetical protein
MPLSTHSAIVVGTGKTVPISSKPVGATWLRVLADTSNSALARLGGTEVTAAIGYPLAAGQSFLYPPPMIEMEGSAYNLNLKHVYLATGDKLHVLYAT